MVAFPPSDLQHTHMMDLHLNVVINDLAVAVFRQLESRIRNLVSGGRTGMSGGGGLGGAGAAAANFFRRDAGQKNEQPAGPATPSGLSISAIANVISNPGGLTGEDESGDDDGNGGKEGGDSDGTSGTTGGSGKEKQAAPASGGLGRGFKAALGSVGASAARAIKQEAYNTTAQVAAAGAAGGAYAAPHVARLTTPLDDPLDPTKLTQRDLEALAKRDAGRREKLAADLSLLAGSPIDAYERYTRAAELTKSTHDPLWYAASLEGCAAAFVAMAEAGGHGVDDYLENNFQLPEEIMALASTAAAQGAGDGGQGGKGRAGAVDRTKTTLPAAVFALADEALGILGRHPKLSPLYAELLLKLAWYTAEVEESHLRCRWGEGEGCYCGDTATGGPRRWETTSVSSIGVNDLIRSAPRSAGGYGGLIGLDSVGRCQKFTNLLHRAVSVGVLDPRSRADVAATCARMCLMGAKTTQWNPTSDADSFYSRLRLPRKAAYFTAVSAEAMTQCGGDDDSSHRASSLWLAASQLYAKDSNGFDCVSSGYAWATLRASVLHALSQQVDQVSAELAAELLLVLLSEISPDRPAGGVGANKLLLKNQYSGGQTDSGHEPLGNDSMHSRDGRGSDHADGGRSGDSFGEGESEDSGAKGAAARQGKGRAAPPMGRSAFFGVQSQAPFLQAQSRWLEDDLTPNIPLPLVDPSVVQAVLGGSASKKDVAALGSQLASSLISLRCVAPKIRLESCAFAQRRCIDNLSNLRGDMPTASEPAEAADDGEVAPTAGLSLSGDGAGADGAGMPPPLFVASAKIVKSETHLLLERSKAAGFSSKVQMGTSMATFFNPYAKKQKAAENENKVQNTLVAEGEERTVLIEFGNRLSVPLEIPSCQLEFDATGTDAIEAPPLSFVVPAKTRKFAVSFPVIIVASHRDPGAGGGDATPEKGGSSPSKGAASSEEGEKKDQTEAEQAAMVEIFNLVGLQVTCLNRSFKIPFRQALMDEEKEKGKGAAAAAALPEKQVPVPASVYQRSAHNKPKAAKEDRISVRLEAVPAQPNLLVSFKTSQTPLEDAAMVPVHLSDGEIYTIPSFRLENDFGPSGMGRMERMQIVACGLPGLPDEVLFDTDALAAAREEEEDEFTESDDDEDSFEELMEFDGLPPLKVKVLTQGLSLRSINDKEASKSHKNRGIEGSIVTFQVAATHDMGNQLANGGNVRIRFRYRGPSPNPAIEMWRKREVSLRIVRVKGPRISSLTFRSDLSWGSAYSELCRSLAVQKLGWDSALPKWDATRLSRQKLSATSRVSGGASADAKQSSGPFGDIDGEDGAAPHDESILNRVGLDRGVHVSGDEVVVLMAVANETNSTIVLSNRKGLVGGFEGSPMPTVRVTSGVSVKIPVVIPRIDRLDPASKAVMDIAAELIARTALQWESEATEGDGPDDGSGGGGGGSNAMKRVRQGRVRIPSRCLREIIDEHKSFASRICRPPVSVLVKLGESETGVGDGDNAEGGEKGTVVVGPGAAVDVFADAKFHDWIPPEVKDGCALTLEFCCTRKDSSGGGGGSGAGGALSSFEEEGHASYVWCGQLRRTVKPEEEKLGGEDGDARYQHRARAVFLKCGTFVVSACAKISGEDAVSEETWWAPHAKTIVVEAKER